MKFTPKPLQTTALYDMRCAMQSGVKRLVLKAPTGVGKTFIAAMIVESALAKGRKVAFVAPYTVLINQTVARFMEQGIPEPGVMQAQHELTDPRKPLQICSAQTLARRKLPDSDIVIVDECDLQFSVIERWMDAAPNTVFIGLTATPFAKGMGLNYQQLVHTKSLRECLDDKTLAPYEAWGVDTPDLSKVGTVGDDYNQDHAAEVMRGAKLVGSVVGNWLEHGENLQTICFAQNVLHANEIANKASGSGIPVAVITANTLEEERTEIFKRFRNKELRWIVNVGVLVAGFDEYVECGILAFCTKSDRKLIQVCGRFLRQDGKQKALIFDHGGNFTIKGYPEDIDEQYTELCNGDKDKRSEFKAEREERIKKPKTCSSCKYLKPAGIHECPKCGFAPRAGQDVEVDETRGLKQLTGKAKEYSQEEKRHFFSELLGYAAQARTKGKNYGDGWVAHKYKAKFGVWPKGMPSTPTAPGPEVAKFIQHQNIKFAKSRKKAG